MHLLSVWSGCFILSAQSPAVVVAVALVVADVARSHLQAQSQDAQNASTSYVVRKVHGRRNSISKFMRKRFVLTILCDKGMPAAVMTTPLREFMDWMRIR
jgi:hypothetical protein